MTEELKSDFNIDDLFNIPFQRNDKLEQLLVRQDNDEYDNLPVVEQMDFFASEMDEKQTQQIAVFIHSESYGTIQMQTTITESIINFKKCIIKRLNLKSSTISLKYKDQILKDNRNLNHYQICNSSIITVTIYHENINFTLHIDSYKAKYSHTVKSFTITINSKSTIQQLKQKAQIIAKRVAYDVYAGNWYYEKDNVKFSDLGIQNNQTFKIRFGGILNPSTQTVIQDDNKQDIFAISVDLEDNVYDIKLKIADILQIETWRISLRFKQQSMVESELLKQYKIEDGDRIILRGYIHNKYILSEYEQKSHKSQKSSWTGKIFFKLITGTVITVNVKSTDSIQNIKMRIADQEKISPEQQIIMFDGKELEDRITLSDYGIQNETMLRLVLKLRGGCFLRGTMITLANGTEHVIEHIEKNDQILMNSDGLISKVNGIYNFMIDKYVILYLSNGNTIKCTLE
eukprot:276980_1